MIGQLNGRVVARREKSLILDVNDVGYQLTVSAETGQRLPKDDNSKICLFTYLAVRDDALELFGFWNETELRFFELLIGISGIGPKTAIAILSVAPPDVLRRAIQTGNPEYLTKMSGVGRKNAERIVLNLKDKLGLATTANAEQLNAETEILEVLQALGYSLNSARQALQNIDEKKNPDTPSRLKAALKYLGK